MTGIDGEEPIMYDFNHNNAVMKIAIYDNRVRIFGTAMARVEVDGVWKQTNRWRINFLYHDTIELDDGGVPDIQVIGSNNCFGSFENLDSGASYDVYNKANSAGISFVLGDGDGDGIRLTQEEIWDLSTVGDMPIEGAGLVDLGDDADEFSPSPREFLFVASGCVRETSVV